MVYEHESLHALFRPPSIFSLSVNYYPLHHIEIFMIEVRL